MKTSRGFSLLELLLSVALIGVIAAFSIPVYLNMQVKNDLDIAAVTVSQTLRRAQVLSQAVEGDISWGVKIQTGSITLFKGTSYAARDSSFDETFSINANLSSSGVLEEVYTKFYGMPGTAGSITLSSPNDSRIITINAKGMIDY